MFFYHLILVLSLTRKTIAFPNSVRGFYDALHNRLSPGPHTSRDACQSIADKEVFGYHEAINCLNSFPLIKSVRHNTLVSLNRTLKLYAFKDIITKSPDDNIPSSLDLDKEMKWISGLKFHTEFEFNSFLTGFFNTLHDGHTRYTSECYSRFMFQQPFTLFMQDFKFWILPEETRSQSLVNEWLKLRVNITKYHGAQVLKINGMDPKEYLSLYSHFYIGKSRDLNSRLILGLSRTILNNGALVLNHGVFSFTSLVPLNYTVTYSLKLSKGKIISVKVPYLVESPGEFSDSASFYQEYCQLPTPNNKTPEQIEKEEQKLLNTPIDSLINRSRRQKRDTSVLKLIYQSSSLMAYKIESETGVLVIPHFKAEDSEIWYSEVEDIFKEFKKHKIKNLVIDLSNNEGGMVYQGYDLLYGLFSESRKISYDMRSTRLIRELSKVYSNSSFSPLGYLKFDGTEFKNKNAFKIKKLYSRGTKKKAFYTPRFRDSYSFNFNPLPINFKPKKVSIVTNFVCYSTCAVFANSLQQLHNIKAYTYGLSSSHTTSAASMAGGSIMTLTELITELKEANLLTHPDAPRPLPNHVSFSFTYRQAYAYRPRNSPLEFTYIPADDHLEYNLNEVVDPSNVWLHIAKDLNDTALANQEKTS